MNRISDGLTGSEASRVHRESLQFLCLLDSPIGLITAPFEDSFVKLTSTIKNAEQDVP
jgi:hypothetical protein